MERTPSTSKTNIITDQTYSIKEVKNLFKKKYSNQNSVTIHDLIKEINNLKKKFNNLKNENNILFDRINRIENGKEKLDMEDYSEEQEKNFLDLSLFDNHLSVLSMIISQKWYTNITLLIENFYKRNFIAMIDSGADLNVIQEGLIPTKYFHKTTHSLSHAGGKPLDINFKLPKAYICKGENCIQTSFLLAKNITSQLILGLPFIYKIYPLTHIDDNCITGTFEGKPISFKFITKLVNMILNQLQDKIDIKNFQINFLKEEITSLTIKEKLKNPKVTGKD